jgi:hypothetical protein
MNDMNLDVIKETLQRHRGGDVQAAVKEQLEKIDENVNRVKLKADIKAALLYSRKLSQFERLVMQSMIHLI